MKIAIIGSGFTGLSSAYFLAKKGFRVVLFEKENSPGGLATGFKQKNWKWSLEEYYHHWFVNDKSILNLAKEINCKIIIKRPKTSVYLDRSIYQLDSPLNVLTFPKLSIIERFRMAAVLAFLKFDPFWKSLEGIKTTEFLLKTMGENPYEKIWEPQLINKFGDYVNIISLAWFWARIRKRTSQLAYPEGGFLEFTKKLVKKIEESGGKILLNTKVSELKENENQKLIIKAKFNNSSLKYEFDKVIVTLPAFIFTKITPQLPGDYVKKLNQLKGLGSINLLLRLKKQFFKDSTYWLSICEKKSPVMAVVEHTNFMDKKYYNNEHLVYVGNYLPFNHQDFKSNTKELLQKYDPLLKKVNPNYESEIIDLEVFKAPFAQPIVPSNYSKIIPSLETPLKNVYLANIQQVYPWDRGTNYSVELGEKAAKIIVDKEND